MSAGIERDIIETATCIWVRHRRHEGRTPPEDEIGLNLHWTGRSWYASVAKYPARTPRRFAGFYGPSPSSALTGLLATLREEA